MIPPSGYGGYVPGAAFRSYRDTVTSGCDTTIERRSGAGFDADPTAVRTQAFGQRVDLKDRVCYHSPQLPAEYDCAPCRRQNIRRAKSHGSARETIHICNPTDLRPQGTGHPLESGGNTVRWVPRRINRSLSWYWVQVDAVDSRHLLKDMEQRGGGLDTLDCGTTRGVGLPGAQHDRLVCPEAQHQSHNAGGITE